VTASKLLLGCALVSYPLIIYLTLDKFGPALLGIVLILLLLTRGGFWYRHSPALARASVALAAVAVGLLLIDDSALVLKLYPALINFALLAAYTYTLFFPPSAIERLVRAMRLPLNVKAGPYMRVVTMVWCGFFIVNGSIATLIAIGGSLRAWTLYNGFIAYLMMGALFAGEFVFRGFYKRRHGIPADPS